MSELDAVSVFIGRFDPLLAYGLLDVLNTDHTISILADFLDEAAIARTIAQRLPAVAILDENVEYALLARLKASQPTLGVLVLARAPAQLYGTLLLAIGVTCLAQTASAADIVTAVHLAARGKPAFFAGDGDRVTRLSSIDAGVLTRREAQVFDYLSRGKSYSEIAFALQIAYETVRTHTRRICRKLEVNSRLALIGMSLATTPESDIH